MTCLPCQPLPTGRQEEVQAERVGPHKIITLGTDVQKHEAVRFSCQPWRDMVPWEGYVCQKTNSTNKEKKNS
jgi:hypothetical protein